MNPLWLIAGMMVGDRLRAGLRDPQVQRAVKAFARETYWAVEEQITTQRFIGASRRWLDSLPVKGVS